MTRPSHDSIIDLLARFNSSLDAAELHGMLCGLLCTSPNAQAKARWFGELLDSAGVAAEQLKEHVDDLKQLEELFDATVSELNSADLTFQLLIPDDTETINRRTETLANWCGGFTTGIGLGGTSVAQNPDGAVTRSVARTTAESDRILPDDTKELLQDFVAISNAAPDDDEASLMALQEYVRMGVLLINEELAPAAVMPQKPFTEECFRLRHA